MTDFLKLFKMSHKRQNKGKIPQIDIYVSSVKARFMRFIILSALLILAAPSKGATCLYFTSSPTSYVGAGQTLTATSPDYDISVTEYGESGYGLQINIKSDDQWWAGLFTAEKNQVLEVGEYIGASRFSIHGLVGGPGIDFFGNGRGNNNTAGNFSVLELVKSGDDVTSVAINFVQYDEQQTSNWIRGAFRFNSSIPVPEPSSLGLIFGVVGLLFARRKRLTEVRHH